MVGNSNQVSTRLSNNLDTIASVIGIVAGVWITTMNVIYSNEYLMTIGPMLIAVCSFYLITKKKLAFHVTEVKETKAYGLIISIVFWFSFAASLFFLRTEILHRPAIYFILTAFCAGMIALQILRLNDKKSQYVILLEILLISLSIRASAFWLFPSIPGADPWEHMQLVRDFVNSGHIETSTDLTYYLGYPITHLNAVAMKLITNVDYKSAMFLAIGLPLIFSTIFTFLIGRTIASLKVGLLAALLVNLSDMHIQFGFELMPTSLGIALFSIIGYLIIRERNFPDVRFSMIAIMFLLLMVINHTMSGFVTFLFIFSLLIGTGIYEWLYKGKNRFRLGLVTPALLAIFAMAMLAYWTYAGYYANGPGFLEAIVVGLRESVSSGGFLNRPESVTSFYSQIAPVIHILGFVVIYLFGTIGILIWLSPQHISKSRFAVITSVTLMTIFALAFPLFGMRNIMPYRWFAFIYVLISIPAALAILSVVGYMKHSLIKPLALATIVFIFSFFMTTNRFSDIDSPVYAAGLTERLMYSDSEMAIGERFANEYDYPVVSNSQYIGRVMGTYLGRWDLTSSDMQNENVTNESMVIWRNVMATQAVGVGTSQSTILLGQPYEQKIAESHNLIYSNNTSKAFLPRGK